MGITDEQQQQLQQLVDQEKEQMDDGELTHRVHLALRRKYDFPEWALFEEVPGKTGKRADAIAFNMFPSRNFKTLGFEVKVSRGDWKKELEDISKQTTSSANATSGTWSPVERGSSRRANYLKAGDC